MKKFIGFLVISGVGWMLDFSSYVAMTQLAGFAPAKANFISSMFGVTYVWMVALNKLFDRGGYEKSIFLPVYWGYQVVSIFGYSILVSFIAVSIFNIWLSQVLGVPVEVVAKILLTPPNLITNFIFMNLLVKFMRPES
ncbi:hypothetical protein [Stutzerimonas zhaodongensis]|uniref:hypothetical protein n=1 Tax=Stutzerimonas zhaodongensis TaxID=1176257 RepID=UPI0021027DB2|nr:hypothetical protein [Stutzerimonas zhaodongensis]MCQ2031180.1 hypothetical protein [Stutzerimonas zhaodongensis]